MKQPVVCLIALVLFASLCSCNSTEFTSPDVAHLTNDNYTDKVKDGKVYFIKYYAPWCGHCKRLADTWKTLGTTFKDSNIVIGHVDCTTDRNVCTGAEIKGYPTLKVMFKGEEVKAYRGSRDFDSLKTFIETTAKEVAKEL